MSFIKEFIERETINRRNFLIGSGLGLVGAASMTLGSHSALAADAGPTLSWSYRDQANPYWISVLDGAKEFVKDIGRSPSEIVELINGGSSEKSLADIKALIAKTSGDLALACDPNDSPNARPVVEACKASGAHIVTIWNKTDDLHPWDFGDNYVAHITLSGIKPCEETARILFKAMGGKGGVVGLGGIASNIPAIERKQGLLNVLKEFPEIKLLDFQAADYNTTKANEIMSGFLTTYGDEIRGVFCASDTMAFGAIEALRAEGLAGQVPVVGHDAAAQGIDYLASGEMLATVYVSPVWTGGIALSLAYYAATGAFRPSAEPHEHREFYGKPIVVTPSDVEAFKSRYMDKTPDYNWKDFWSESAGQIQYVSK